MAKEYDREAPLAEYHYAGDKVIARNMFGLHGRGEKDRYGNLQTKGGLMYYHTDALGTPTGLTDRTGEMTAAYRFDAFGSMFAGVLAPYSSAGLTGKTYDATTGLIDFGARPYDPKTARFTQADTFKGVQEKPLTQNPYAYVGNNPVNNTDPTGHAISYVNLYIDGSFNQIVDLYSPPGTTYFHNTSVAVRPYYEARGYTVGWQNGGVWVTSPPPPGDGDGGNEPPPPPPEPTPEERRDEFNTSAGAVPVSVTAAKSLTPGALSNTVDRINAQAAAVLGQQLASSVALGATGLAKQGAIYAAIKVGLDGIVKLSGGSQRSYAGPWDQAPSLGTNNGAATYSAQWGARFVAKKALEKVIKHLKDPKLLRWFKPYLRPDIYKKLDEYRWDIVYALQPLLKYNELLTSTVVNTVRNTLLNLGVRSSTADTISWIVGKALEWI